MLRQGSLSGLNTILVIDARIGTELDVAEPASCRRVDERE